MLLLLLFTLLLRWRLAARCCSCRLLTTSIHKNIDAAFKKILNPYVALFEMYGCLIPVFKMEKRFYELQGKWWYMVVYWWCGWIYCMWVFIIYLWWKTTTMPLLLVVKSLCNFPWLRGGWGARACLFALLITQPFEQAWLRHVYLLFTRVSKCSMLFLLKKANLIR